MSFSSSYTTMEYSQPKAEEEFIPTCTPRNSHKNPATNSFFFKGM
jgi:hypothetical protein